VARLQAFVALQLACRERRGETLAADHPILSSSPGGASLSTPLLPPIFLTATSGQCSHTQPRPRGAARITPTLTFAVCQPPASTTEAATSSGVIDSSSPVTLNYAVFRGTATLAGKSRRAPAIFTASRDTLLLASWPAISNVRAPVTSLLGLTSTMPRSESLISLLTTDIAFLYVKPEPFLTVSATAAHRGGGEGQAYLF
jgi:hypothetical protein